MRHPKLLLAPLCALATGCAPEVPLEDRVVHLDLRLADGSSPARQFSSGDVLWTERVEIDGPSTDLGTWSTQYCRVDATGGDRRGIALRGIVPDGARMKRIELRSSRAYPASDIDFLELVLARTSSGIARVAWRSSIDEQSPTGFPRSATAVVPDGSSPITLRIPLSSQPGWAGEISELSIAPKEEGIQGVDVLALRLGRAGFSVGPDALETAGQDGPPGQDGGLIALGREARRAFPCDWNVPLFARAHVPRGGRLAVEAGVSSSTINLTAEVRFRVDAREAGASEWESIGSTSIVPGMRPQGPAWEHMSVDLAAFEGRELELRFLADDAGDPHEGGKLDRARLYWGEPLVFGEQPPAPRPNVILITLDTVRADAIGAMRSPGGPSPTPFLDGLAARGMLFENAWSACNATSPSHASLMTGLAVQDHGLLDNRSRLAPENRTLAEAFRAGGWQTAAAVSVPHLTPNLSGLGQGFDRFWLGGADSALDGAKTIAAVREWWRAFAREGRRPTFLWLHLFDAHTPYDVPQWFLEEYAERLGVKPPGRIAQPPTLPDLPPSGATEFLAGVSNRDWPEFLYGACVSYQDELLRQLFTELRSPGVAEDAFIAVIADHGEALGEHGNWYHHTGLYREVMHVPLIVCAPGGPRGARVKEPVWSLDLARTLFGISGALPPEARGVDLLELAVRPSREERRIFFEHARLPQVGCVDLEHTAIWTRLDFQQFGPERAIAADTLQLFDARGDPGQARELQPAPESADRYRELFRQWSETSLQRPHVPSELTAEEDERLRQNGY